MEGVHPCHAAALCECKYRTQILKVMLPDGRLGPTVEAWLAEQGLDTPKRSADAQSRYPSSSSLHWSN